MNLRNLAAALFVMVMGLAGVAPVEAGTITIDSSSAISGTGFGTRLTILSLQCGGGGGSCTETGETSYLNPDGTGQSTNQDSALTIQQLIDLGITGIEDFGLVYNLNQTGNSADPTLTQEVVTFYGSDGTVVAQFTLVGTFTAGPYLQGNGGSGYLETFVYTNAEAAAIANLFSTCPTCLVGKSATITGADDGADSFFVFDLGPTTVPDGGITAGLLGFGLLAMGYLKRRVL